MGGCLPASRGNRVEANQRRIVRKKGLEEDKTGRDRMIAESSGDDATLLWGQKKEVVNVQK